MIELLIADDHAIVRKGLMQIFLLMPELTVVAEARDGQEVLTKLQHTKVDLLLLDVCMPGFGGAELIVQVRQAHPDLPILVLSMYDKPHIATQMLAVGANGYITKDCEPDILLTAIRKVAAHGNYIDPVLAEKIAFNNSSASAASANNLTTPPRHSLLSPRELEVLRWLIQGQPIKQIGEQLNISNKTVSTHKLRLMQKLDVTNMPELMRYAIEHRIDPMPQRPDNLPA